MITELDPADLTPWDLRVHIASDRAGGWGPTHFIPASEVTSTTWTGEVVAAGPTACEIGGSDPGESYGLTSDRAIWERWYAAGHGCQACAEVLHS